MLGITARAVEYAVIGDRSIQFMGRKQWRAQEYAAKLGLGVYCFDCRQVKNWFHSQNLSYARYQIFFIDRDVATALQIIGTRPPCLECSLNEQIESMVNGVLDPERYFARKLIEKFAWREVAEEQRVIAQESLADIVADHAKEVMHSLRKEESILSDEDWEKAEQLLEQRIRADKQIADMGITAEAILEVLRNIDRKELLTSLEIDSELTSEEKEMIKSTRRDVRDNKLDPKLIRKVQRYEIRCKVLECIRENDVECLGKTQKEISKEIKVSIGLVNKIEQWYRFDNNLKNEDIQEKICGRKPNPFLRIPYEVYCKLRELMSSTAPCEIGIDCMSWSAKAIRIYLKRWNIDVTEKYIYKFCRKTDLSSKFATRKNPRENREEIEAYITDNYPELCRKAISENAIILHVDETHIQIHPRITFS